MSYQLGLITRVINEGAMNVPLEYGLTSEDFTSEEGRRAWDFLLKYYTASETRGSTITPSVLRDWGYTQLWYDYPNETLASLCYNVRRERALVQANASVTQFVESMAVPGTDPILPINALRNELDHLLALGTKKNSDTNLAQGLEKLFVKMDLAQKGINLSKMSWPWAPLDQATLGVQPDDYIVLYGRPKSMKTWVLCYLFAWAWVNEKKIVLYTKEMTDENVWMRTLACIHRFPYQELREAGAPQAAGGRPLSAAGMQKLKELREYVKEAHIATLLTVLDGRQAEGHDTVPWLESKVQQYKPDIVFVDGLYLMSDHKKSTADHQRVMNISRALRALVLNNKTPVIATMQANRKAAGHKDANLDEIAYSDALSQDCTIAMRVIAEKGKPFIDLIMGGSREFSLQGLRINGVPASDFSFKEELTAKDIEKAKENDNDEGDAKAQKPAMAKKKAKSNGYVKQAQPEPDLEYQRLSDLPPPPL